MLLDRSGATSKNNFVSIWILGPGMNYVFPAYFDGCGSRQGKNYFLLYSLTIIVIPFDGYVVIGKKTKKKLGFFKCSKTFKKRVFEIRKKMKFFGHLGGDPRGGGKHAAAEGG